MNNLRDDLIYVGDIHGDLTTLEALVEVLTFEGDKRFVFLGDYVNRGPDSKGVIDFLISLSKSMECVFLKGNHDECLLSAVNSGVVSDLLRVGGAPTISSYTTIPVPNPVGSSLQSSFPRGHRFFLDNLQESYHDGDVIARHKPWKVPPGKLGVCGHVEVGDHPIRKNGLVYIDTGCGEKREGWLTAFNESVGSVTQVSGSGDKRIFDISTVNS